MTPVNSLPLIKETGQPYRPRRTIIISNHLSNADGIILRGNFVHFAPDAKIIMKASLFKMPIVGWAFWLAGDPGLSFNKEKNGFGIEKKSLQSTMDACLTQLNAGVPLLVFPEGTRSRSGRLQLFKDGFFKLAVDNDIEIFPVAVHNTPQGWSPGSGQIKPAPCSLIYGRPINPRGHTVEQLRDAVRNQIIELIKTSPHYDPKVDRPIQKGEPIEEDFKNPSGERGFW